MMKRRSLALIFIGMILILVFPTLNSNMEAAITGGNTMVMALRILITIGVLLAAVGSLSVAAYEEIMR